MKLAIARHNINFTWAQYAQIFAGIFSPPKRTAKVEQFEQTFARYTGVDHCIMYSSGTAAFYHALKSTALQAGDRIVVPSYEFTSMPETLRMLGLQMHYAPVSSETGNLTPQSVEQAITDDTKAVLVANIHGKAADLPGIKAVCDKRGVMMIEDCAHSNGASIQGRKTGTFGAFSIFSFGHGKNLSTCRGGAVCTNDPVLAKKLRERANALAMPPWLYEAKRLASGLFKGLMSKRTIFSFTLFPPVYLAGFVTGNILIDALFPRGAEPMEAPPADFGFQMTDISATIGMSSLARLDSINAARRKNHQTLFRLLGEESGITFMAPAKGEDHVSLNAPVTVDDGTALGLKMFQKGIDSRKDFLLDYDPDNPQGQVPSNTILLPNNPSLSESDMERIANVIRDYLKSHR